MTIKTFSHIGLSVTIRLRRLTLQALFPDVPRGGEHCLLADLRLLCRLSLPPGHNGLQVQAHDYEERVLGQGQESPDKESKY